MTDEPRMIFLGALTSAPGEAFALAIPPGATPEEIAAKIEVANIERAAAPGAEFGSVRGMFACRMRRRPRREPPQGKARVSRLAFP